MATLTRVDLSTLPTSAPAGITAVGAANGPAAVSDASDASYLAMTFPSAYLDLTGTFAPPSTPAGHVLAAVRLKIRQRCAGRATVNAASWGGASVGGYGTSWYTIETAGAWVDAVAELAAPPTPGNSSFYLTLHRLDAPYEVDFASLWAEYDYRQLPALAVATPGTEDRNPAIQLASLDLDGAEPASWAVTVDGPMAWAGAGLGAWPGEVRVGTELPDGSYTVSVTITSAAGSTTASAAFVIASSVPLTYLQDVALDDTLAAHFSMACNSVAGLWYCDRAGVLQFTRNRSATYEALLTDEASTDPLAVAYTGLTISYDSKSLVNRIDATNRGLATDTAASYTNAGSAAAWGERSVDLDVCVYDVGGALAKRVRALAAKYARPARAPRLVTFNAQDYPWAAKLDLSAKVRVRHRGVTYGCVVVGVDHNVGPSRWFTTLHLITE